MQIDYIKVYTGNKFITINAKENLNKLLYKFKNEKYSKIKFRYTEEGIINSISIDLLEFNEEDKHRNVISIDDKEQNLYETLVNWSLFITENTINDMGSFYIEKRTYKDVNSKSDKTFKIIIYIIDNEE